MTTPTAPTSAALSVTTDRAPSPSPTVVASFNADRAQSDTNPCWHDWEEVGSCEFGCTRCGAIYSYDTDPVHGRHAALSAEEAQAVARALPNVYTPAALLEATRSPLAKE